MHHRVQGWTGIAQRKGVPMKALVDLVKPTAAARAVASYSYGERIHFVESEKQQAI